MSIREKMLDKFGPKALAVPATLNDLYMAVDQITETMASHKGRLDALEGQQGQKGMKPRHRVPAETRRI